MSGLSLGGVGLMKVLGRRAAPALEQSREGLWSGTITCSASCRASVRRALSPSRTIDRDHPPDPTYLSMLPRAAGERGRLAAWSDDSLSPLRHSEREPDRYSGLDGGGQVRCGFENEEVPY